jgi:hypothetical protein
MMLQLGELLQIVGEDSSPECERLPISSKELQARIRQPQVIVYKSQIGIHLPQMTEISRLLFRCGPSLPGGLQHLEA